MEQCSFNMNFESFQNLLLKMAEQRSVEELLPLVTCSLAANQTVALARIWMNAPGDICDTCGESDFCKDKAHCLHLMASHGVSLNGKDRWDATEQSKFRRFPIGVRKVGVIASSGKPANVSSFNGTSAWVADSAWVRKEHVASFVGQPLLYKGEVLGVLAMFTRTMLEEGTLGLMRMIADHLAYAIANARAFAEVERLKSQIENENAYLRKEVRIAQSFSGIIGKSVALQRILQGIDLVAPTDTSVLISGETGTGNELIAREIHSRSNRSASPMIKINCAAIPRELFESEFFGHVRGAFTGASKDREGLFQTADQGTLFLDEVSEIPIGLQGKLLRVLQEGEYQRVGEERVRKVNVRIISATNRHLDQEVRAGRFRKDLYYRLNVFPCVLPPLRERMGDIPLLVRHFLCHISCRLNRPEPSLTPSDYERLSRYGWPGNIRELQNVIERAVITSHLGEFDQGLTDKATATATPNATEPPCLFPGYSGGRVLTNRELRDLERENVVRALRICNGKIYGPRGASEKLGIKPTTLVSRIKTMKIISSDWQ